MRNRKKKRLKKSEQSLRVMWDSNKWTFALCKSQKKKRERGREKFEDTMTENSNLMEDVNINIQEAQ